MAVSIRDIAREAGVTVGTVSRALNNYPDVSPTTRERIVETAQRLGYRPNQMARNLSSKHNHNIALVLSGFLEEELINDFDALLMKGCFHYTVNNDVEMSIQVINTKIQTEKSFEQLCYEHNIAGAILMGLRTNDPYCELLAKSKYPCVTIDIEVPGPNVSCVMMDDIKAFDELTQYLIDNGHRRLWWYMAASWLWSVCSALWVRTKLCSAMVWSCPATTSSTPTSGGRKPATV